jgi:hypothetical protein
MEFGVAIGPAPDYTFRVDAPPQSPPQPTPQQAWARATMWMVVVLVLAVNAVIFFRTCTALPGKTLDKAGQVIDKAGHALSNIAAAFNHGSVTTAFLSYATTISNHQRLQVATLRQTEVFTQTNQLSTGFGTIPLPDVVVEARAPVEYTYYLDLNASWRFVLKDGVIRVTAPALHFNKPAVDASAISYEVRKGYFKSAEAQESLKRSVTSLVTIRAKENVPLVRENARKQTAEFVENWLMKSFTDAQQHPVKVYFADEKIPDALNPTPGLILQTNGLK